MSRIYNFSAGPSTIPEEVMLQAQEEFMDWNQMGMSIMEFSHRSKEFKHLAEEITEDLRELLAVPKNYHILFFPGGARAQFAAVPMNLRDQYQKFAYVNTGIWSKIALTEAKIYADVDIVASSEDAGYTTIPDHSLWNIPDNCAYLHYTDNETVNGVEFTEIPDSHGLPLVCDMSSNILSRPLDVSQFGIIYACAQKNMGMSGITFVIVRDDLLARQPISTTPSLYRYAMQAEQKSMVNTTPTYPVYMAGLVFKWLKRQGGVAEIAKRNQRKAQKLYEFIDQSDFYQNNVDPKYRSRMNVIFTLADPSQEERFVSETAKSGLVGLKGHRFVGGMRASIYNAMPEKGIDALIEFMQDFISRV